MRHLVLTAAQIVALGPTPSPDAIERVLGHTCESATLRGCHLTLHDAPRAPLALHVRAEERTIRQSSQEERRRDWTIEYSPKRKEGAP